MKINGTDKTCHWIKGGGRRLCQADEGLGNMAREKYSFGTEVGPSARQIWDVNPPGLFLLVDMALKAEPVCALGFGEITLEVLTAVLICYFVAESKKGR